MSPATHGRGERTTVPRTGRAACEGPGIARETRLTGRGRLPPVPHGRPPFTRTSQLGSTKLTAPTATPLNHEPDKIALLGIDPESMGYYDFARHWARRIMPHLGTDPSKTS